MIEPPIESTRTGTDGVAFSTFPDAADATAPATADAIAASVARRSAAEPSKASPSTRTSRASARGGTSRGFALVRAPGPRRRERGTTRTRALRLEARRWPPALRRPDPPVVSPARGAGRSRGAGGGVPRQARLARPAPRPTASPRSAFLERRRLPPPPRPRTGATRTGREARWNSRRKSRGGARGTLRARVSRAPTRASTKLRSRSPRRFRPSTSGASSATGSRAGKAGVVRARAAQRRRRGSGGRPGAPHGAFLAASSLAPSAASAAVKAARETRPVGETRRRGWRDASRAEGGAARNADRPIPGIGDASARAAAMRASRRACAWNEGAASPPGKPPTPDEPFGSSRRVSRRAGRLPTPPQPREPLFPSRAASRLASASRSRVAAASRARARASRRRRAPAVPAASASSARRAACTSAAPRPRVLARRAAPPPRPSPARASPPPPAAASVAFVRFSSPFFA